MSAILVAAFVYIEGPLNRWLKTLDMRSMLGLSLVSALVIAGLVLLVDAALGSWQLPTAWVQTALAATPGTPIDPLNLDSAFTISGTWLGMMAGAAWLYHRQGGFKADGTPSQRLLRFVVGLVGIVVFWYLLGKVFPREQDLVSFSLRFLRYTLIGLWVTALAPLLFEVLGLSSRHGTPAPAPLTEA